MTHDDYDRAREYINILARRLIFSRFYSCFFVSLIVACITEVLWVLLPHGGGVGQIPTDTAFVAIEAYVTVGLALELLLRGILQHKTFWLFCSECANVLDCVVVALSILSNILTFTGHQTETGMVLSEILITGRVIFRLMRLGALTKSFRRQQAAATHTLEVDMRGIESPSTQGLNASWEGVDEPTDMLLDQATQWQPPEEEV